MARPVPAGRGAPRLWLFDLDNTLHDAGRWAFPELHEAMGRYVQTHLALPAEQAGALSERYWLRYGATLLGLMRHHGVRPAHFLHETHRLPGLEDELRSHRPDLAALARLRGRRVLLTNAPRDYAMRVLQALRMAPLFDAVIAIEDMRLFGQLRPKPDARMLRALLVRLGCAPQDAVLVEDTLGHLRSARRVGLRTVWMQRWLRHASPGPRARGNSVAPRWLDQRTRQLRTLTRLGRG
ncbi:HAD-IA family hydrolase [Pseudaquabacterium rugosum]|uniref:HAD-IA family hydrolase n=1 Tax=Pseudaquabacterium rugosum TaxID=2984194 RepID=A0ABU9BEQ4_9BURK